jgi:hypothetical protein
MLDENCLTAALKSVQYERLTHLTYKATWGTRQIEHFLYFSVHGVPKQFVNAHFGFRNPVGELFSVNSIRKYGGEVFKALKHDERTDCLMRFSFHRLGPETRRWSINIAAFSGEELAHVIEASVRERLFPAVCAITGLSELFQALAGDKEPYPWVASNGAIRAAHIVAAGMQLGLEEAKIRAALSARERQIAAPNSGLVEARSYVSDLLNDWTRDYGTHAAPQT